MCIRKWLVLAVVMVVSLGGCSTPAPVQQQRQLRFTQFQPLTLDVSRIEVVSEFKPTFKEPNYEHLMPVSPEAAAKTWAQDRLRATGTGGRVAYFHIRDASAVETKLPMDQSVKAFLKKQQSERYHTKLNLTIEIRDENGRVVGEASAAAERGQTVGQDVSMDERSQILFDLVRLLCMDINTVLENNIRQYLVRYMILSPPNGR